ncbi:hypothetical protein [Microcoleus sp. bin38.metabat.b11b12b14.051]|uniref:hypothetical protein n=1 Tax=Microcoleus sp. bin38.metabat.b11b12b14.051 TaxID=2742709 RepID=UPI0026009EF1|nr:hypothetical protein [Microcoleus sp. bin38.metabat.b11b12b14.051]
MPFSEKWECFDTKEKTVNNKLLLLASSACVLTALVPVSRVFGAGNLPQILAETKPVAQADAAVPVSEILPKLKGKTQVPIFLPSRVTVAEKLFYQSQAKPDSYTVSMEYTADCKGAGACTLGEIRGQKGGEFSTKMEGVTKTLKTVQLAGGVKGNFHNGCGAYCTANLEWKNQGFMYTVAIKNGQEADLVKIANSAIQAGKR